MATMIDAAAQADAAMDRTNLHITIKPSERQCDEDGSDMTLHEVTDGHHLVRIHRCPVCGYERRYGGAY